MNKLKRAAAALIAMVLILGCIAVPASAAKVEDVTFTEVDEIVYVNSNVNIRSGPGTEHTVITTLRAGQAIRRTGIGSNGWSRVSYMGEDAYMYTKLLHTSDPGSDTTVSADRLERQIAVANGLKEWEYTAESWKALAEALKAAEKVTSKTKEETRKAAADALEKAIAGLVSMNYADLEQVIEKAKSQISDNTTYALVDRLRDAVVKGEQLRFSGDQAQVDACAGQIGALLEELKTLREQGGEIQTIIQEVEVEVPPTGAYCNIPSHRIWPVACAVSVVLNVILVVVLVIVLQKRKYRADDVPLVDYDIDDDI